MRSQNKSAAHWLTAIRWVAFKQLFKYVRNWPLISFTMFTFVLESLNSELDQNGTKDASCRVVSLKNTNISFVFFKVILSVFVAGDI